MNYSYDTFPTPVGDFSVAVNDAGAVVATAFGGLAALRRRLPPCTLTRDAEAAALVRGEITEYFAGARNIFTVPTEPAGTPFQQRVWKALRAVPHGETRSYGALAAKLKVPRAARAVGRANATNPVCLIIPCHRVIGQDGSLTGYAFGEKIKARLLAHEAENPRQ